MPNYNVEQNNLDAVEKYINQNNTTAQNSYISSKPPIFRIQELNGLYNLKNTQEKKLSSLQNAYDEKWEEFDKETDSEKKKKLKQQAEDLKKQINDQQKVFNEAEDNYNQQMEEARRYIKVDLRNGRVEAQLDNGNNEYGNWLYIDPEGNISQKTTSGDINYGNAAFMNWNDIPFQKTTVVSEREQQKVEEALNLLRSGEEVPSAVWNELEDILTRDPQRRQMLQNITNDIYDSGFRYNFERNISNEGLYDIRNYNNFRSSNRNDSTNPTTAENTNASKSFYMSRNDFYWSLNYNDIKNLANKTERQSIQNIILNEYQPTLQYNLGSDLFGMVDTLAAQGVKLFVDHLGMNEVLTKIGGFAASYGAGKAAEAKYNDYLSTYSQHPEWLYDALRYKEKINPMYYIERLFSRGTWLNTFELPFVANSQVKNDYLKLATDPGTWNIGGLTDKSGNESISNVILHDRISISLPTSPTFSVSNPHQATMGNIDLDFFIINKDDQYLDKNFQFMQALFAGTQWLSMELGVVAASNVYQVVVPGRFMIHWASLLSKFEAMGKLRTNEYMYARYGDKIKMILFDTLWPLVWHVSLTIKPLTPWNFNTHMAYYNNGYGSAERQRLYNNIAEGNYMNTFFTSSPKLLAQAMERQDAILRELSGLIGKGNDLIGNINLSKNGLDTDKKYIPPSKINDLLRHLKESKERYQQILQDQEMMKEVWRAQEISLEEIENRITTKKLAFKGDLERQENALLRFKEHNKELLLNPELRNSQTWDELNKSKDAADAEERRVITVYSMAQQNSWSMHNNDIYKYARPEDQKVMDEKVLLAARQEKNTNTLPKVREAMSQALIEQNNKNKQESKQIQEKQKQEQLNFKQWQNLKYSPKKQELAAQEIKRLFPNKSDEEIRSYIDSKIKNL